MQDATEAAAKRRALITVRQLCGYTGSELHTLAMGRMFQQAGYDVTLAVFDAAYPLLGEARARGMQALVVGEHRQPLPPFDVVLAQHFPVLDDLLLHRQVVWERLVVSILGPKDVLETPPSYAKEANLITFVSEETQARARWLCSWLLDGQQFLFYNYAPREYFAAFRPGLPRRPRRMAAISNHICPEVAALRAWVEAEGGRLDLIGVEYEAVPVTPELLGQYDVVITIGKTVQFCMAAGIPVYCYDAYGGPGYITTDNFDAQRTTNFSGRGQPIHRTTQELWQDIQAGYARALQDRRSLQAWTERRFSLETQFAVLLERLLATPARPQPELGWDAHRRGQAELATLYMRSAPLYRTGRSAVYWDMGKGYAEEGHGEYPVIYHTKLTVEIPVPPEARRLRFDPDFCPCICQLHGVSCGQNLLAAQKISPYRPCKQGDLMLDDDPQYEILLPDGATAVTLTFTLYPVGIHMLLAEIHQTSARMLESERQVNADQTVFLSEQERRLRDLQSRNAELQTRLEQMEQSTLWRLTAPLRHLKDALSAKKEV